MRLFLAGCLVLAVAFADSRSDGAQTPQGVGRITGRVSGGVNDPLPGAVITALRQGQGVFARTESDRSGRFVLDNLGTGRYSVEIDFQGFDVVRRNNVIVSDAEASLVVELQVSTICECITYLDPPAGTFATVEGVILGADGRPLPHTSLEIRGAPPRQNRGYSGLAGEFTARLPIGSKCTLVVGRPGFVSTTRELQVASTNQPVTVRLDPEPAARLPDHEILGRPCRCAGALFVHPGW
jgi:hypothetical protein